MPATFNDKAHCYANAAVVQRALAAWLSQWLEPSSTLASLDGLELGAGEGLFTRTLAERLPRLRAVDVAPRMVEHGRQHLPQVAWQVADAWQLDGPAVDRLYSASLLHWCDEPIDVLRHWRGLVRPGGRMLHGFYVAPTLAEWQSLAAELTPVAWRTADQWLALFREAGWQVLRSEARLHVQRCDSARSLARFFHRTGSATRRQTPVGRLRTLLADYDRCFATNHGSHGVVATWTFFRIEAGRA